MLWISTCNRCSDAPPALTAWRDAWGGWHASSTLAHGQNTKLNCTSCECGMKPIWAFPSFLLKICVISWNFQRVQMFSEKRLPIGPLLFCLSSPSCSFINKLPSPFQSLSPEDLKQSPWKPPSVNTLFLFKGDVSVSLLRCSSMNYSQLINTHTYTLTNTHTQCGHMLWMFAGFSLQDLHWP